VKRAPNPPEKWIRRENAFPAVVPPKLFWAAQRLIAQRRSNYLDQQLLEKLSALLSTSGRLTTSIIDEDKDAASYNTYRLRFGSLLTAYQLIGYTPDRSFLPSEKREFQRHVRDTTLANIISVIEQTGCQVEREPKTHSITVDGEISISVSALLCRKINGKPRWRLTFGANGPSDILVAVRLAPGNHQILDYYILPRLDPGWGGVEVLRDNNGFSLDGYRFATLDRLFQLVARRNVAKAG
jgi:hypothetical protein